MKYARILKIALEKAIGRPVRRVWYVPIHGPCMEMQGYAGGWMYEEEDGFQDCIGGYSAEEAIEAIVVKAQLITQSEIIDALRKQDKLK